MLKLHVMCFADSFNIEVSPNLYLKTHVAEQKKDCEFFAVFFPLVSYEKILFTDFCSFASAVCKCCCYNVDSFSKAVG